MLLAQMSLILHIDVLLGFTASYSTFFFLKLCDCCTGGESGHHYSCNGTCSSVRRRNLYRQCRGCQPPGLCDFQHKHTLQFVVLLPHQNSGTFLIAKKVSSIVFRVFFEGTISWLFLRFFFYIMFWKCCLCCT